MHSLEKYLFSLLASVMLSSKLVAFTDNSLLSQHYTIHLIELNYEFNGDVFADEMA